MKGDSSTRDDDDKLTNDSAAEPKARKDESFLLDSEFPPDNMAISDDENFYADSGEDSISSDISSPDENVSFQQRKTEILSQLNASSSSSPQKTVKTFLKPSTAAPQESTEPSKSLPTDQSLLSSSDRLNAVVDLDGLINLHRQHLRLFSDLSKIESKLIVNASLRTTATAGGIGSTRSTEAYVGELEGILAQKMQSVVELQTFIANSRK